MTTAAALALAAAAVNGVAAAVGGWVYLRAKEGGAFWPLLRAGQAAAVAYALYVAVLAATGHHPKEGLFYLYALLPIAVGFIAEQLRLSSASLVLAKRGLEGREAVAALPRREQYELVYAILRREVGVMALAAFVVMCLALRAAQTAHGV